MMNQFKVRGGKVHQLATSFVISDEGGWLEGSYDSMESAKLAIKNKSKNDWSLLSDLAFKVNFQGGREITIRDIQEFVDEKHED